VSDKLTLKSSNRSIAAFEFSFQRSSGNEPIPDAKTLYALCSATPECAKARESWFFDNRKYTWDAFSERINSNDKLCAAITVKTAPDFGSLNPDDMMLRITLRNPVFKKVGARSVFDRYDEVPGESSFYTPLKSSTYPARTEFCIVNDTAKGFNGKTLSLIVAPVTKFGDGTAESFMPMVVGSMTPKMTPKMTRGPHPTLVFDFKVGQPKQEFVIASIGSGLVAGDKHGTKLSFANPTAKFTSDMLLNTDGDLPGFPLIYSLSGTVKGPETTRQAGSPRAWSIPATGVHTCIFTASFLKPDGSTLSGFKLLGVTDLPNDGMCSIGAPANKQFDIPKLDFKEIRSQVDFTSTMEIGMKCTSPRVNLKNKMVPYLSRAAKVQVNISNFDAVLNPPPPAEEVPPPEDSEIE